MKSLLFLATFSLNIVFAQSVEDLSSNPATNISELYAMELNENAAQALAKKEQNEVLIQNVNNLVLKGNVQRSNVKLALSYYLDFAQPCVARPGNPNENKIMPFKIEDIIDENLITKSSSDNQ